MMIIEAVLDIELEARQSPYQRFVPVDEILVRAPETTREAANPLAIPVRLHENDTYLIPDALYGIEHDEDGEKGYRFWAIECERTSPEHRSNQRLSSTGKKKELYTRLLRDRSYGAHWGIPNLKVQFVNHKGTSDYSSV
ncbi:hypothetical protein [Cognatishimia sp. WU-CL00825]|uniref:hypothetical protein n=1 Tax=Cognatishimia sp. WU-CL00825 TaxID=3127658 RepID=UPI0033656519